MQEQIVAYFREAVLSGRLASGSRVPSSRALAFEQGVARITVVEAYERLVAEGYLVAHRSSGFFVADGIPLAFHGNAKRAAAGGAHALPAPLKSAPWSQGVFDRPHVPLALSLGMPAVDEFPWSVWRRITQQIYRQQRQDLLCYGDPRGALELRTAIARYLGTARGIACDPEQIIVVSGSQQGIDLITRALVEPGDQVWIEEPGYAMARAVFQAAAAKLVLVPVDRNGIDVACGVAMARRGRLAAVSPSYQYPLGVTLSLPRRLALLEWAQAANAWILEDDYAGEFRYTGKPLPPLYNLDGSDRVIYLGTFSKSLAPALRQGFLVAPPDLVERLKVIKLIVDRQSPVLDQHVLARFIAEGHLAVHLRRMRTIYRRRRIALLRALRREAGGLLHVGETPEVGLHIVARLRAAVDDVAVSRALLERQIHAAPLSQFYTGTARQFGFALGFAGTDEGRIAPAVRELVRAIKAVSATSQRRARRMKCGAGSAAASL